MKRLSTVASIIALCATAAAASPSLAPRPAPRTLDRLTHADLPDGTKGTDRKVSSRLRAAEGWAGPLAGGLVPAGPPRSPDGKLQVYVDCSPLGAEQLAALEQGGVTVDGVEPDRGRVRGSVDPAALDRVAAFCGCTGAPGRPPSCGREAASPRAMPGRGPTSCAPRASMAAAWSSA
jgi:hypothetical protein